MIYKNEKEIQIEKGQLVSICIYSDNKNAGQIGSFLDTTIDWIYAFSNGFNEGYVEYDCKTEIIKTNGNINTYIVVK